MEVRKIVGSDVNQLRYEILKAVENSRFTCEIEIRGSKLKILMIRLREKKPYCGNHPNACEIGGGPNRKGNWLEGADWVSWNDLLNDICDDLGVSCSISSTVCWIRRGNNRRINYGSHLLSGNFIRPVWEWDYVGEECDYEDHVGRFCSPASYPYGTPGEYTREYLVGAK